LSAPFTSLTPAQAHDLLNHVYATIIAIVVAYLLVRLAAAIIDRFFARRFVARYIPRVATYSNLAKSAIRGLTVIALVLVVLNIWSVDVVPAVWSAGVITAVLAFGAQTIVRDLLTGFSFFLEDQFDVGDRVQVTTTVNSTIAGAVEAISLRTTVIIDEQGRAVTIPNGNILYIVNSSRLPRRARVSIDLPLHTDVGRMRATIADIAQRIAGSSDIPADGVSVTVQDVRPDRATFSVEFNAVRAGVDVAEATMRERLAGALQAEGWLPGSASTDGEARPAPARAVTTAPPK
jgi:small-conductance mechanosensitive channel